MQTAHTFWYQVNGVVQSVEGYAGLDRWKFKHLPAMAFNLRYHDHVNPFRDGLTDADIRDMTILHKDKDDAIQEAAITLGIMRLQIDIRQEKIPSTSLSFGDRMVLGTIMAGYYLIEKRNNPSPAGGIYMFWTNLLEGDGPDWVYKSSTNMDATTDHLIELGVLMERSRDNMPPRMIPPQGLVNSIYYMLAPRYAQILED